MAVQVLLLTGTVGVGKTTILREVGEVLRLSGIPHGRIDLDWLGYGSPAPGFEANGEKPLTRFGSDLVMENLAAVWPNYRSRGLQKLAVARALLDPAREIAALHAAVPDSVVTVCLLDASEATVAARVESRELGIARSFLRNLALELHESHAQMTTEHFVVQNSPARSVTDVAHEVLVKAKWLPNDRC